MSKNLSELHVGESGTISFVEHSICYLKLMEMGCVSGAEVTVVHKAILDGPIAIRIAGYTLSLRKSEAQTIHLV